MKGLFLAISLAFTLSTSSVGYADEKKSPEVMIEQGSENDFAKFTHTRVSFFMSKKLYDKFLH